MTTRRARISRTTRALIQTMREPEARLWTNDYRKGFRQAVSIALIYETPWSLDAIHAYIDKQLGEPGT